MKCPQGLIGIIVPAADNGTATTNKERYDTGRRPATGNITSTPYNWSLREFEEANLAGFVERSFPGPARPDRGHRPSGGEARDSGQLVEFVLVGFVRGLTSLGGRANAIEGPDS